MLVVTTESIPGFEVRAVIGEVVGVTARSFNPFIEGVKSLNGRLNPQLVRLLAQIRQEAVAHMVEAAKRRGRERDRRACASTTAASPAPGTRSAPTAPPFWSFPSTTQVAAA